MRFLADESCDFAVVTALRAAGHDVVAVAEQDAGVEDTAVLSISSSEARVLIAELGDRLVGAFVVVEPGRVRISRPGRGK